MAGGRRRIDFAAMPSHVNFVLLQENKMIDKRTLLPRLAVLGGLAFSLPIWGQYSSPIRDVSDPGRAPFQSFSQNLLLSGDNTPIVVTSLPVSSSQRLVVDFINLRVQGSRTLPSILTVNVSASATLPGFQITFPVFPISVLAGAQQISLGLQSFRFYVSAGQTLQVQTLNQGSAALFIDVAMTGHYVSLP